MNSTVTIRLVPIPDKTIGSGKNVRTEPGVNAEQLAQALRPLVEPEVRRKFGDHVEVKFQEGKVADIRLDGVFPDKAATVKLKVGAILSAAFDGLDSEVLQ